MALVGWLVWKGFLVGELFTTSRNWLTLEGESLQSGQFPRGQGIRRQKIKAWLVQEENCDKLIVLTGSVAPVTHACVCVYKHESICGLC